MGEVESESEGQGQGQGDVGSGEIREVEVESKVHGNGQLESKVAHHPSLPPSLPPPSKHQAQHPSLAYFIQTASQSMGTDPFLAAQVPPNPYSSPKPKKTALCTLQ